MVLFGGGASPVAPQGGLNNLTVHKVVKSGPRQPLFVYNLAQRGPGLGITAGTGFAFSGKRAG